MEAQWRVKYKNEAGGLASVVVVSFGSLVLGHINKHDLKS